MSYFEYTILDLDNSFEEDKKFAEEWLNNGCFSTALGSIYSSSSYSIDIETKKTSVAKTKKIKSKTNHLIDEKITLKVKEEYESLIRKVNNQIISDSCEKEKQVKYFIQGLTEQQKQYNKKLKEEEEEKFEIFDRLKVLRLDDSFHDYRQQYFKSLQEQRISERNQYADKNNMHREQVHTNALIDVLNKIVNYEKLYDAENIAIYFHEFQSIAIYLIKQKMFSDEFTEGRIKKLWNTAIRAYVKIVPEGKTIVYGKRGMLRIHYE